jgi:hypothetical protein
VADLLIEPARLEEAFMEYYADAADDPDDPDESDESDAATATVAA